MKYFSFLLVFLITCGLGYLGSISVGTAPPMGYLLDPHHGFWQNMYSEDQLAPEAIDMPGLSAPAKVLYDQQLIPHVFASNEADLYRIQGYVTAQHRLWQMEFQTIAASGRISEIVGSVALEVDRMTRRKGLGYGAELGLAYVKSEYPDMYRLLEAYAEGVNQYIEEMEDSQLPIEYKILNYKPEKWTPYKSLLLLKYMSDMLVGDRDVEFSNLRKILGQEKLDILFPEFPEANDPVIEAEKSWDFDPLSIEIPEGLAYPSDSLLIDPMPVPEEGIGSNNWAVAGSKTKNGKPILANDPHLSLNFPSLWYSMQLSTPTHRVKGASLPGALGIISGFNDHIAWGVTNATKDARDWYKITFQDEARTRYRYGDDWKEATHRIEEIKIKGEKPFYDTVIYTQYGPVVYDRNFGAHRQDVNFSLKWTAHMGSNEQETFLQLNKAQSHRDYSAALDHFSAPAQNFVFASVSGDIAMRIQGKFPLKWKGQGKFFMDGADPRTEWQGYIPNAHNPSTLNPERGFVSSANQHPVDPSYPYYVFDNSFEQYRNRRLNSQLRMMDSITVEDMKALQFDDYHLHAAEALPVMLALLGSDYGSGDKAEHYLEQLRSWDYFADPDEPAVSLFELWWKKTHSHCWQEWLGWGVPVVLPSKYQTVKLLTDSPDSPLLDLKDTPQVEKASDHVRKGFEEMLQEMETWEKEEGDYSWANYKQTSIQHLVPQFKVFSEEKIFTGGGRGMLNATSERHGASWRMVVELGKPIKAWGIYPGGQSGNPGSRFYKNFISKWASGEYLDFDLRAEEQTDDALFVTTFSN